MTTPDSDSDAAYFHTHPVTASILSDPSYTRVPTVTKHHHDPFFRRAGRTNSAVLHWAFLYRVTPHPTEGHLLLHVGHGVCGQSGIAHGGFLATVMDEVCGNLIDSVKLDEGLGMVTAALNVGYKRAVMVEGFDLETGEGIGSGEGNVIIATARLDRVEGRKVFIEAVIRDEKGKVCTTAQAIFVKKKPAL